LRKLAATDRTAADLVHLRYFGGLTIAETSRILSISSRTADRLWSWARAWLHGEMEERDERTAESGQIKEHGRRIATRASPRPPTRRRAMLVLTRKVGEQIVVGDDVCITIVAIRRDRVRLGINAPTSLSHRKHQRRPVRRDGSRDGQRCTALP
jgi:carbon storage regulator CsrA